MITITDPAAALATWERQPGATIYTDGVQYAVTTTDLAGWYQSSPEELAAALARQED